VETFPFGPFDVLFDGLKVVFKLPTESFDLWLLRDARESERSGRFAALLVADIPDPGPVRSFENL